MLKQILLVTNKMKNKQIIAHHYHHGDLLKTIVAVLEKQKKSLDTLSLDDLAAIDEFHIGGQKASQHFFAQLSLNEQYQVLDIGCGLGGAARFVAQTYGAEVTGIDLTQEYIETGNVLSQWLKLTNKVKLYQGSALTMPFANNNFSCAYILMILQNVCFRTFEKFMIKAQLFINGCSLKNRCNDEHGFLRSPRRASLKGLYAALLILTRE
ncbi:MAG: class I SAM-dependent methyltransferase [Alteromonadaceae bacterium]|nr:class I SAM-dependent methyltransferase [Alteromonadaceae bacterium]